MSWRRAEHAEAPLLARMNAQLIHDEGHSNRMTAAELEPRMRAWLAGEYTAVLFEEEGFVVRDHRRRGVGRRAFDLLVGEVLSSGTRVVVEVLSPNARALAFWQALGLTDYARALERRPVAYDRDPTGQHRD